MAFIIIIIVVLKEVARGGERTQVLLISFIFSFSQLFRFTLWLLCNAIEYNIFSHNGQKIFCLQF
jgi:hypothetical protein